LASILLIPSFAFSNIFTFKVGLFNPRADSDRWTEEFDQMDFAKSSFVNTNFGFGYEYFATREISIAISIDSYHKKKTGIYEGYVGYYYSSLGTDYDFAYPDIYVGDFLPAHSYSVTITPIQLSIKLTPMGRKGGLIPYLGGGVGLYIWSTRVQGDWIDFNDEWYDFDENVSIYPIYLADVQDDNRFDIGYHAFGGFMAPFARRMSLEVEFKYNFAKGDLSEDKFEGYEAFDLNGFQISIGVNYWF